jgi:hypothetical protein
VDDPAPDPEPVEEPSPRREPRTRLVLVVAGVLVLVGLLLAWVDQQARSREDRDLAACSDQAYAAAVRADQVLGSMAEYIRPSLAVRSGLWDLMSGAAERARPGIDAALARCRDVEVLGLHRTHVRERAAYVDYLAARAGQLDAIEADGRAAGESDPELGRLREAAFGDRP